MSNVKILFFATLRERVGVRSMELQIPAQMDVAGFKSLLVEKFPALQGLTNHVLISINGEYVSEKTVIPKDAEIALFPPVSGG